ncbi:sphingomyelin phosphodiesterase isoform X2 [Agrilus planipennis]|nr:sphingomyelin phosphodiesterase isoform X2 [Agrilus planipennis]
MILGESCEEAENASHKWDIDLPDIPKPPIESLPAPNIGKPSLKVLQISDTHFDPEYTEGSPINCKEPLCCRSYSTPENKEKIKPAGKWGSPGNCDAPLILIENMFENIVLNHPDIDYIIWTGDLPPHDIWNQTKNQTVGNLQEHVKLMQTYFPNVPIFPVLGNHEAVPAGSFPPPWVHHEEYSIRWLYEEAQDQWKKWLPTTSNSTIQQGGFYSVLIRPGFRIISINTNYCSSLSWWLLLSSTDPAKELKWLVYELQEAESKGEKVHIIGHIPPGYSDCLKEWSKNYNKIINRYQNTITGQFFGHTHGDEFEVFYDDETSSIPTNVAYLCPSVTTFGNYNPAYRIYYVDGEHDTATWEILDHETWTTNLEEANNPGNSPHWYKLYSAKEAYSMESLRPVEWEKLIQEMTDDPIVFGQFYKYYYRDTKGRPYCDLTCKIQMLCDLKSGRSHDRKILCSDIETKILAKISNVKSVQNKSKKA